MTKTKSNVMSQLCDKSSALANKKAAHCSVDDDIDTCKVCMENYEQNLRPRSLNCGHSFCSDCLNKLSKSGRFDCPKCQRPHTSQSSHDFPINYDLEEMISKFRENTTLRRKESPSTSVMSSKMQCFFEDQIDHAENLLEDSNRVLDLLTTYRNLVQHQRDHHQEILPSIYELASRNEDMVTVLDAESTRLSDVLAESENLKDKLRESLSNFKHTQSITAIADVDQIHAAMEQSNAICRKTLNESIAISRSNKLTRATTAAMNAFTEEFEKDEPKIEDFQLNSVRLEVIEGCQNLSLRRLQDLSKPTRSLIAGGRVFAIQERHGKIRSAKVSLTNDDINLHYLKNEEPPSSSYVIEQSVLMETVNQESVTVFMDLAWNGLIQGRIHILLQSATPLGRQFQALCTGDQGPSYAHCRFLEVAFKGDPTNEALRTGDYEHNDGSGGASLWNGLNIHHDMYQRLLSPGIVWATYDKDDGPCSSQFTITTGGDANTKFHYRKVFGSVTDGMDVVKAAAKLDDIACVKIADCGVVLQTK